MYASNDVASVAGIGGEPAGGELEKLGGLDGVGGVEAGPGRELVGTDGRCRVSGRRRREVSAYGYRRTPWQLLKRGISSAWSVLHRRQLAEIEELRKDVDALLAVLDHWITPGAGDKQRQFEFMAEVLEARHKRGISGASMQVASLSETNHTF
jgi:hypothetical protein